MEGKRTTVPQAEIWFRNPKKLAVAAGILIVVFMLGYVPSCIDAQAVREQNTKIQSQLELSELRAQLGIISYEANRNNYGTAAQLSSEFFDGVSRAVDSTSDPRMREKLQGLLAQRDQITTELAQVNPAVKEKLANMYAELHRAIRELKQ
jgi:hypothetical protein